MIDKKVGSENVSIFKNNSGLKFFRTLEEANQVASELNSHLPYNYNFEVIPLGNRNENYISRANSLLDNSIFELNQYDYKSNSNLDELKKVGNFLLHMVQKDASPHNRVDQKAVTVMQNLDGDFVLGTANLHIKRNRAGVIEGYAFDKFESTIETLINPNSKNDTVRNIKGVSKIPLPFIGKDIHGVESIYKANYPDVLAYAKDATKSFSYGEDFRANTSLELMAETIRNGFRTFSSKSTENFMTRGQVTSVTGVNIGSASAKTGYSKRFGINDMNDIAIKESMLDTMFKSKKGSVKKLKSLGGEFTEDKFQETLFNDLKYGSTEYDFFNKAMDYITDGGKDSGFFEVSYSYNGELEKLKYVNSQNKDYDITAFRAVRNTFKSKQQVMEYFDVAKDKVNKRLIGLYDNKSNPIASVNALLDDAYSKIGGIITDRSDIDRIDKDIKYWREKIDNEEKLLKGNIEEVKTASDKIAKQSLEKEIIKSRNNLDLFKKNLEKSITDKSSFDDNFKLINWVDENYSGVSNKIVDYLKIGGVENIDKGEIDYAVRNMLLNKEKFNSFNNVLRQSLNTENTVSSYFGNILNEFAANKLGQREAQADAYASKAVLKVGNETFYMSDISKGWTSNIDEFSYKKIKYKIDHAEAEIAKNNAFHGGLLNQFGSQQSMMLYTYNDASFQDSNISTSMSAIENMSMHDSQTPIKVDYESLNRGIFSNLSSEVVSEAMSKGLKKENIYEYGTVENTLIKNLIGEHNFEKHMLARESMIQEYREIGDGFQKIRNLQGSGRDEYVLESNKVVDRYNKFNNKYFIPAGNEGRINIISPNFVDAGVSGTITGANFGYIEDFDFTDRGIEIKAKSLWVQGEGSKTINNGIKSTTQKLYHGLGIVSDNGNYIPIAGMINEKMSSKKRGFAGAIVARELMTMAMHGTKYGAEGSFEDNFNYWKKSMMNNSSMELDGKLASSGKNIFDFLNIDMNYSNGEILFTNKITSAVMAKSTDFMVNPQLDDSRYNKIISRTNEHFSRMLGKKISAKNDVEIGSLVSNTLMSSYDKFIKDRVSKETDIDSAKKLKDFMDIYAYGDVQTSTVSNGEVIHSSIGKVKRGIKTYVTNHMMFETKRRSDYEAFSISRQGQVTMRESGFNFLTGVVEEKLSLDSLSNVEEYYAMAAIKDSKYDRGSERFNKLFSRTIDLSKEDLKLNEKGIFQGLDSYLKNSELGLIARESYDASRSSVGKVVGSISGFDAETRKIMTGFDTYEQFKNGIKKNAVTTYSDLSYSVFEDALGLKDTDVELRDKMRSFYNNNKVAEEMLGFENAKSAYGNHTLESRMASFIYSNFENNESLEKQNYLNDFLKVKGVNSETLDNMKMFSGKTLDTDVYNLMKKHIGTGLFNFKKEELSEMFKSAKGFDASGRLNVSKLLNANFDLSTEKMINLYSDFSSDVETFISTRSFNKIGSIFTDEHRTINGTLNSLKRSIQLSSLDVKSLELDTIKFDPLGYDKVSDLRKVFARMESEMGFNSKNLNFIVDNMSRLEGRKAYSLIDLAQTGKYNKFGFILDGIEQDDVGQLVFNNPHHKLEKIINLSHELRSAEKIALSSGALDYMSKTRESLIKALDPLLKNNKSDVAENIKKILDVGIIDGEKLKNISIDDKYGVMTNYFSLSGSTDGYMLNEFTGEFEEISLKKQMVKSLKLEEGGRFNGNLLDSALKKLGIHDSNSKIINTLKSEGFLNFANKGEFESMTDAQFYSSIERIRNGLKIAYKPLKDTNHEEFRSVQKIINAFDEGIDRFSNSIFEKKITFHKVFDDLYNEITKDGKLRDDIKTLDDLYSKTTFGDYVDQANYERKVISNSRRGMITNSSAKAQELVEKTRGRLMRAVMEKDSAMNENFFKKGGKFYNSMALKFKKSAVISPSEGSIITTHISNELKEIIEGSDFGKTYSSKESEFFAGLNKLYGSHNIGDFKMSYDNISRNSTIELAEKKRILGKMNDRLKVKLDGLSGVVMGDERMYSQVGLLKHMQAENGVSYGLLGRNPHQYISSIGGTRYVMLNDKDKNSSFFKKMFGDSSKIEGGTSNMYFVGKRTAMAKHGDFDGDMFQMAFMDKAFFNYLGDEKRITTSYNRMNNELKLINILADYDTEKDLGDILKSSKKGEIEKTIDSLVRKIYTKETIDRRGGVFEVISDRYYTYKMEHLRTIAELKGENSSHAQMPVLRSIMKDMKQLTDEDVAEKLINATKDEKMKVLIRSLGSENVDDWTKFFQDPKGEIAKKAEMIRGLKGNAYEQLEMVVDTIEKSDKISWNNLYLAESMRAAYLGITRTGTVHDKLTKFRDAAVAFSDKRLNGRVQKIANDLYSFDEEMAKYYKTKIRDIAKSSSMFAGSAEYADKIDTLAISSKLGSGANPYRELLMYEKASEEAANINFKKMHEIGGVLRKQPKAKVSQLGLGFENLNSLLESIGVKEINPEKGKEKKKLLTMYVREALGTDDLSQLDSQRLFRVLANVNGLASKHELDSLVGSKIKRTVEHDEGVRSIDSVGGMKARVFKEDGNFAASIEMFTRGSGPSGSYVDDFRHESAMAELFAKNIEDNIIDVKGALDKKYNDYLKKVNSKIAIQKFAKPVINKESIASGIVGVKNKFIETFKFQLQLFGAKKIKDAEEVVVQDVINANNIVDDGPGFEHDVEKAYNDFEVPSGEKITADDYNEMRELFGNPEEIEETPKVEKVSKAIDNKANKANVASGSAQPKAPKDIPNEAPSTSGIKKLGNKINASEKIDTIAENVKKTAKNNKKGLIAIGASVVVGAAMRILQGGRAVVDLDINDRQYEQHKGELARNLGNYNINTNIRSFY